MYVLLRVLNKLISLTLLNLNLSSVGHIFVRYFYILNLYIYINSFAMYLSALVLDNSADFRAYS